MFPHLRGVTGIFMEGEGMFQRPSVSQAFAQAGNRHAEIGRPFVLRLRDAVQRVSGLRVVHRVGVMVALTAKPLDVIGGIILRVRINVMALQRGRPVTPLADHRLLWIKAVRPLARRTIGHMIAFPHRIVSATAFPLAGDASQLSTAQTACSFCASAEHAGFSQVIDQRLFV